MLVYVNNVLHFAKDAQEYILKHNQVYQLREGLVHQVDILGPTSINSN